MLDGYKIVVPKSTRRELLVRLHASHAGTVKLTQLAHELYFWPGMNNEIKTLTRNCRPCQELAPSQPKEPLMKNDKYTAFPFADVSVDLAHDNQKNLLIMVDRFSGFPFVYTLSSTTTNAVINALLKLSLIHI